MGNIFNFDNKFFQGMNKVIDCFYISILWLIFSIPIITIGASTTALYDTVHRVLNRGCGYVFRTFWGSFKSNFKHATKIWLIQLVIFIVLFLDSYISRAYLMQGSKLGMFFFFFVILMFFEYIWVVYTCGYSARFEQDMKGTMKNAALLAVAHLPFSAIMIALFIGTLVVIQYLPFLIFLMPAVLFIIYEVLLEKVFRKIMSPEELQRELEQDWEKKDK